MFETIVSLYELHLATKKVLADVRQDGHDGPESLTRNNCFSVLEIIHCQYFLIVNLSIEYL
jgi:hypothetical protein